MRDNVKIGAVGIFALILVGLFYEFMQWRWDECRKVGHGVFYCLLESSK